MRVGILLDPLSQLNLVKDSTLDLVRVGIARSHDVEIFHPADLTATPIGVQAAAALARLAPTSAAGLAFGDPSARALSQYDFVLMRTDPPVDMAYVASCHLLAQAENCTRIVNRPSGVLMTPEKVFPMSFPELHPPTVISRDWAELSAFREAQGDVVVKPLYDFCGNGVFLVMHGDKNYRSMCDTLMRLYKAPIVVQKFIPEVRLGDKRVFMVAGEPIAAIDRMAPEDDARSNMFVGGTPIASALSDRDLEICRTIGPVLAQRGIVLAGLDIIGEYLTEVNVTSPTGILQIRDLCDIDVSVAFWKWMERTTA